METMNVYAQDSWHQPVTIAGNRAALEHLMECLKMVLEMNDGREFAIKSFTSDGEGYELRIVCVDNPKYLNELALPYTDPDARGTNEGKVYP